jgi:phage terminase large subunit-like protein
MPRKKVAKPAVTGLVEDELESGVKLDQDLVEKLVVKAWSRYIPVKPTPLQLGFCVLPNRTVLYGGAAGGGKLLAEDGVVLTPFGWKGCRDLRVGDRINAPDGTTTRIVQLKPWVRLAGVRVTFHDGTSTLVAWDHLWLAWGSGKRSKRPGGETVCGEQSGEVVETRELAAWLEAAEKAEAEGKRPMWPLIPVCQPQVFNVQRRFPLLLDPYKLGFWLGDGHWSSMVGVTSVDRDHVLKELPEFQPYDDKHWRVVGEDAKFWKRELVRCGLEGTKAHDKFIPEEYLWRSIEDRWSLLQGLMDTDGYVSDDGKQYYTTVSKRLARGVCTLVRSLGGVANVTSKIGAYRKGGESVACRRAYTVYIKLREATKAFRLGRKRDRCIDDKTPMYKRVVSVEEEGTVRGRCLTVAHPSGLYLTNDFIVTHNSESLLMAALQYVDVPGYSAIIFRKTYTDLAKSGAIMDRALSWLGPHLGKTVSWNSTTKTFTFMSGAKLEFGYMGQLGSGDAVQGTEYHFIGVDEVTQHYKQDIVWAESRLRRTKDVRIPIRVRFTGNPGNRGNEWVKDRFKIRRNPRYNDKVGRTIGGHFFSDEPLFVGNDPEEIFIPARLTDNPYLNHQEYVQQFRHMDDLTRSQLLDGDWDSSPVSRFKRQWFPAYTRRGEYFCYGSNEITAGGMRRFCTVDVAASLREGVGGEKFYTRGGKTSDTPCWTVVATWGTTGRFLYLLDIERGQVETPDVFAMIGRSCKKWNASEVFVEGNGVGRPVAQVGAQMGLPITEIWTLFDKIQNSYTASLMAKAGKILVPEDEEACPWLPAWRDEIFTWTGHPDETADQVDTLSSAARVVQDHLMPEADGKLIESRLPSVVRSSINSVDVTRTW